MPLILIFFLILAVIEIGLWIFVAEFISGWWVFFWFFIAFFIGLNLIRNSIGTMMPEIQKMRSGQMNSISDPHFSQRLVRGFAGLLFIIPGLLSDVFAVLLLIPPVQRLIKRTVQQSILRKQQTMFEKMMGGMGQAGANNPMADLFRQMQKGQSSDIIEGEAREIDPDTTKDVGKIEHDVSKK